MKKTYLYAAIAIFCWSTVATTCKLLLNELDSIQLLWMNSLIAGVFLVIVNLCIGTFKAHRDYNIKDYLLMACAGIPGTFFYYILYYTGTDLMPASQAFIINYLWPIMSVLFACIILKEKLTFKKIAAILVSFLGVIVVIGGALAEFDLKTLLGAVCCILGAVSYGIFTSLNQKLKKDKMMSLMVSYFATFAITTVINAWNGTLFLPRVDQMAGFLWNGIFPVAIANSLWVIALEKGKTAKISNLAYITPFLSSVWTSIFLHESITINSIVGLVIIFLGIFIQLNHKEQSVQANEIEC